MSALITCALHTLHVETAERRTALSETGLAEKATSAVKIMATFVVYFRLLFQIVVLLNYIVCKLDNVALEGGVIYYALNWKKF
jgi:hypothetical protein